MGGAKCIHFTGYYIPSNLVFINANFSHRKSVTFPNLQDPAQGAPPCTPRLVHLSHFLSTHLGLPID